MKKQESIIRKWDNYIEPKIACPECKGVARVSSDACRMFLYGSMLLLLSICMIGVPVIGWICIPIYLIASVVFLILSIIAKIKGTATVRCPRCKCKYKVSKDEYLEFKAIVKNYKQSEK